MSILNIVASMVSSNAPKLTSIKVTKQPDKVTYTVGQDFDPTGIEVEGYFDNGCVLKVDSSLLSYSASGPLTVDDTSVTVTLKWGDDSLTEILNISVIIETHLWWSPQMTANDAPAPFVARSSSEHAEHGVHFESYRAFDGKMETCWYGFNSGTITISFDFGRISSVSGIRMSIRMGYPIGFPKDGAIEGSYDGENWTEIASFSDESAPAEGMFREHKFETQRYRHYRLTNLVSNFEGAATIGEIEFYRPTEDL